MISLKQPGSGKEIRVHEDAADSWRALGYTDSEPAPKQESKPAPRKRTPAKKSSK